MGVITPLHICKLNIKLVKLKKPKVPPKLQCKKFQIGSVCRQIHMMYKSLEKDGISKWNTLRETQVTSARGVLLKEETKKEIDDKLKS